VAEGSFHESLNLAALWQLPVLFVCENNYYAMGTALARHQAETDISRKGDAYRMPAGSVDGMDVLAVAEAVSRAATAVRGGAGPFLLECRTYRFRAHSMYDPELYRTQEEVEAWKLRDPIRLLAERLEAAGALDGPTRERLDQEAEARTAEAIAFAEEGAWEPVTDLLRDVCAGAPPC
jgi:pyruvate dehydrogenase E1 component alpha subunit